jgi:hypothetical protein
MSWDYDQEELVHHFEENIDILMESLIEDLLVDFAMTTDSHFYAMDEMLRIQEALLGKLEHQLK